MLRTTLRTFASPSTGDAMPGRIERDSTLVVVLLHDGREIERCVCSSPDAAVAVAIRMLCRRGDDLKGGDTLKVLAPN
jgi:hypothetical protein